MQEELQLSSAPDGDRTKPRTIQERFEAFHKANPAVYKKLVEITRGLKVKGFNSVGIGMVFEVVRWHYMKEIGPVDTTEGFTLNNVFRSRYARLIMRQEKDLDGIFETRELTAL